MSEIAQESEVTPADPDVGINAAIEAWGGDMRATIRALLIALEFAEEEARRLRAAVSPGYIRQGDLRSSIHGTWMAAGHSGER